MQEKEPNDNEDGNDVKEELRESGKTEEMEWWKQSMVFLYAFILEAILDSISNSMMCAKKALRHETPWSAT
jgi:hypothetical protein